MDRIIEQMLKQYNTQTVYDKKNAIKEVVQEIVLCGLSRAGFFKDAAFYRGTALRIFYGLDRFSEDLDFSLLEKEIRSHGLNFRIETKEKSVDTDIKSAFLKGNTIEHIGDVKEMLCNRFASINYVQAKQDVEPFIKNSGALDIWNADFFSQITQGLKEDIR